MLKMCKLDVEVLQSHLPYLIHSFTQLHTHLQTQHMQQR